MATGTTPQFEVMETGGGGKKSHWAQLHSITCFVCTFIMHTSGLLLKKCFLSFLVRRDRDQRTRLRVDFSVMILPGVP